MGTKTAFDLWYIRTKTNRRDHSLDPKLLKKIQAAYPTPRLPHGRSTLEFDAYATLFDSQAFNEKREFLRAIAGQRYIIDHLDAAFAALITEERNPRLSS